MINYIFTKVLQNIIKIKNKKLRSFQSSEHINEKGGGGGGGGGIPRFRL